VGAQNVTFSSVRSRLVVCAALAASFLARPAVAAPPDLFGFGPRNAALGMTAAASSEGWEATWGNPALLAETRQKALVVGASVARHALSVRAAGVREDLPIDPMKTIAIGAALPIPFGGALRDRVTFGLAFLDPTEVLVRARILNPERPQFPIVGPRVQSLAIALGTGVRIGDRLQIGVGFSALAAVVGEIVIGLDATGRTRSRTDNQVVAAYAPTIGAAYDLGALRIGATFRGELVGRFAITIRARELGLEVPDFNVAGLAQYVPAQLALEARWSSSGPGAIPISRAATIVAGGLLGRRWSAYPGPNEPTVLGNASFGTGAPPIDARDTLSPRVGIERRIPIAEVAAIAARAGWAFEPTPLPEQRGRESLFDGDRHVVTAGVAILHQSFAIESYAQLHAMPTRTHEKIDGPVDAGGTIVAIGTTFGVRF
jgi:long-chain fatty acid transport protein